MQLLNFFKTLFLEIVRMYNSIRSVAEVWLSWSMVAVYCHM